MASDFNGKAIAAQYRMLLEGRMALFANGVETDAKGRCPVRATDKRRGSKRAFLPGQSYKLGKVTLGANEIAMARERAAKNDVAKALANFITAKRQGRGVAAAAKQHSRALTRGIGSSAFGAAGAKKIIGPSPLYIVTRKPRRQALTEAQWEKANFKALSVEKASNAYSRQIVRSKEEIKRQREQHRAIGRFEDSPGRLRRSIEAVEVDRGAEIRWRVSAPATRRDGQGYAVYVEFPTYKTAAQPFMLPALKASKARMKRVLTDGK